MIKKEEIHKIIMEVEKKTLTEDKNIEEIEVKIPAMIYNSVRDKIYRDLQDRVKLPGFRHGKIPRQIIDSMVGKENINAAIFEDIARDVSYKLIKEYGDKNLVTAPEFVEGSEPKLIGSDAAVKFNIHRIPRVTKRFEQYKDLEFNVKVEKEKRFLERNVKRLIKVFRRSSAILTPIEDGAKEGNAVRNVVKAYDVRKKRRRDVEEEYKRYFYKVEDSEYVNLVDIDLVRGEIDEEIYDALLGAKKGEQRSVILKDDAGKYITLMFDVKGIYDIDLPELTDELVRENSEYETIKDLEDDYLDMSKYTYDLYTDFAKRMKIKFGILKHFDVDISDRSIEFFLKRYKEDKKEEKSSDEELRNTFRKLLAHEAVYSYIAQENSIEPTEEDIERELISLAQEKGITLARAKLYYNAGTSPFSEVDKQVRDKKVEDFLMKECKINIVEKELEGEEEHEDAASTNSY